MDRKNSIVSIIVPCFNEEDSLNIFYNKLKEVLCSSQIKYEIVMIDDGSNDNTLNIIKKISNKDKNVSYISFSRNFGKESAIYAGLCNAHGDFIGIMDADMQDPPTLLPKMLDILENEDYDCVATKRVTRTGEPKIRSWFAHKFYKIINAISNVTIVDGARDFRLMKRQMVDSIINVSEYNRFSKGIFSWVGFKTYWISYENCSRVAGTTKWSFLSLFKYAINGILDFSNMPLDFVLLIGIIMIFLSLLILVVVAFKKILLKYAIAASTSIICVLFLIGGIQLFCLGIVGKYIGKIYDETRNRPIYIIKETNVKKINK